MECNLPYVSNVDVIGECGGEFRYEFTVTYRSFKNKVGFDSFLANGIIFCK